MRQDVAAHGEIHVREEDRLIPLQDPGGRGGETDGGVESTGWMVWLRGVWNCFGGWRWEGGVGAPN